MDGVVINEL